MARSARIPSGSNIYHVMMRGVNRQNIFEDDEDRRYFMTLLAACRKVSGFRLYAFVLMANHVHLLMKPEEEPLDSTIKRIGTRYAIWFNQKYQRVGHLFQDRYRSEPVESDGYFLTVLRYILQNPVKAGQANHPGAWRWSSFLAYEKGKGTITDTQYALEFFGSREELVEYLTQPNEDAAMDEEAFDRELREDLAKEKMVRISGCTSASEYQRLDRKVQKYYAGLMCQEGVSANAISRMTGMSRTTVYRLARAMAGDPEEEKQILAEPDPVLYDAEADEIIW